jgi:endonuclease III
MRLENSPYNTVQEEFRDDPWKMLIACFMCNQTGFKQVNKVKGPFFERFPTPQSLVDANDEEIVAIIKPLGFYNKRAKGWKEFSKQWIDATSRYHTNILPIQEIERLKGVGKYALDSWKVFQLYQYDIEVDDHVLNWYVDWAKAEVERLLRESSPMRPITVYYLHMKDDRGFSSNWNTCHDYAKTVLARTTNEAIERVKEKVLCKEGAIAIKVMGVVPGKYEWLDTLTPIIN